MTITHSAVTDEARIRGLTDEWADAFRAKDLDGVMAGYAPDIEVFGITPPLHYQGVEGHRKHWEGMFASFQGPIGYEIRDLRITLSVPFEPAGGTASLDLAP